MQGVVAAGTAHTARAASEILSQGGNAVDAVVAGALASFAAEPLLASAGGAGILTLALADTPPSVVDFFSHAPVHKVGREALDFEAVEVDFGEATQVFHIGRGSAAAPVALEGLAKAAARFGTLPLTELVRPALALARDGVPMSDENALVFRLLWPIVARDDETVHTLTAGGPPEPGTVVRNPALADTLEAFAEEGRTPAHMREAILAAFGPAAGGLLTARDLDTAAARVVRPLTLELGDTSVCTSPRIGGRLLGVIVRALGREAPAATEADEVRRWALASVEGHRARSAVHAPGNTTHISAIDGKGDVAAVTLTNGEGCGHIIPGTGIQMNNFLGEEDLNPHGYFNHAPGVELPSMIAPTVALREGRPMLALGSGGSNRIRSVVSQVLYRNLCLGEPLLDAVQAPRVHAEEGNAWVELEGLSEPDAVVARLRETFANVFPFRERHFYFGGVHAVEQVRGGSLVGAGDPRRGGATSHV